MEKRVYFHIDVNSAFLSWEAVDRLEKGDESTVDIRNIPSAIGGDVAKRHGIVLAKSIPWWFSDIISVGSLLPNFDVTIPCIGKIKL